MDIELSGKRARTKAANREAILEAARIVFAEIGFEATSVRDIVRRTDLASGTFYNYFKSKEDIVEALVVEAMSEFRPALREASENAKSFEDYLFNALLAYFRFLTEFCADEIIMQSNKQGPPRDIRQDSPEIQAIFIEIRQDIEAVLDREGNKGIDTEYLTASVIGLARELGDRMMVRMIDDPSHKEEDAAGFATKLILHGVNLLGKD